MEELIIFLIKKVNKTKSLLFRKKEFSKFFTNFLINYG